MRIPAPCLQLILLCAWLQGMTNRNPPLAQKFSNPGRYRLTPEGLDLAERLFAFAVEYGEVPPLAGVDDAAIRARVTQQRDAAAAAAPAPKRRKKASAAAASAIVDDVGVGEAGAAAAPEATAAATKPAKAPLKKPSTQPNAALAKQSKQKLRVRICCVVCTQPFSFEHAHDFERVRTHTSSSACREGQQAGAQPDVVA
jgi:hypothetical protein